MPKTYTVREVAEILGYSTNSIYSFLKEKRIKGVRVGRGRFRIPEEELRRVLHLSKNPEHGQLSNSEEAPSSKRAEGLQEDGFAGKILSLRLTFPDIFSWFIGLSAITGGAALFVFNKTFTMAEFSLFTAYVGVIRTTFIITGVGIILGNVLPRSSILQRICLLALATGELALGFFMLRAGQAGAALFYAGAGLVIWFYVIFRLRGLASLGLYTSLVLSLLPLVEILAQNDAAYRAFLRSSGISPVLIVALTGFGAIIYVVSFWLGYRGNRFAGLLAGTIGTIVFYGIAVWYGQLQMWSRSFFVVTLGFFTAVAPFWRSFTAHSYRRRLFIHGFAVGMGIVFLFTVFIVGLLQSAVWERNKQEFMAKLSFGSSLVESTVRSIESTGATAATNSILVNASLKKDASELTSLFKVFYQSTDTVRRIVFLDAKGRGVALYPYGTFDVADYSFRDYFINARDSGKPYLSNGFTALVDNARRYAAVVSVPVFDGKGTFTGVLAFSIDFERLGLKLARSTVVDQQEVFRLADGSGNMLIGDDERKTGAAVPQEDPLRRALAGEQGVVYGNLPDGTPGMTAYGPVDGLGWAISISAPANRVFALSASSTVLLFGVIIAITAVAMVAGCILEHWFKTRLVGDGP